MIIKYELLDGVSRTPRKDHHLKVSRVNSTSKLKVTTYKYEKDGYTINFGIHQRNGYYIADFKVDGISKKTLEDKATSLEKVNLLRMTAKEITKVMIQNRLDEIIEVLEA